MTADLKHVNGHGEPLTAVTSEFSSKLTRTIAGLYIFTLVTVSLGTWLALYQNWTVRLEDANSRLVRSANMGNFLVETALTSAAKSLDSTQASFSQAIQTGELTPQLASRLLNTSYAKFKTFNKTDSFGLLFFVDRHGKLYAQTGNEADTKIDFSDRLYFYKLRDNPDTPLTVGPLVLARTTGQWVFHMSVPVYGKDAKFAGVLVQQILEHDIAEKLTQYANTSHFEHMMSHFEDHDPCFVYPPPNKSYAQAKDLLFPLAHTICYTAVSDARSNHLLMGFAKSPNYELKTYATFPLSKLKEEFWEGNKYLILYAVIGILFSTAIFYYLLSLSRKLATVQVQSLHDALTRLHNRRALDDALPTLLRNAMRTQEPISVLFIDIDHFRYFNENYGHESGDIALQAVAQALASCARRPLDFVCRWGGEEFAVVLPETDRHAAMKIADNILNAVRQIELQCTNGDQPRLTVSVGHVTATISPTDITQRDLVDEADKAMLQAKSQGRNQRVEYAFIPY